MRSLTFVYKIHSLKLQAEGSARGRIRRRNTCFIHLRLICIPFLYQPYNKFHPCRIAKNIPNYFRTLSQEKHGCSSKELQYDTRIKTVDTISENPNARFAPLFAATVNSSSCSTRFDHLCRRPKNRSPFRATRGRIPAVGVRNLIIYVSATK